MRGQRSRGRREADRREATGERLEQAEVQEKVRAYDERCRQAWQRESRTSLEQDQHRKREDVLRDIGDMIRKSVEVEKILEPEARLHEQKMRESRSTATASRAGANASGSCARRRWRRRRGIGHCGRRRRIGHCWRRRSRLGHWSPHISARGQFIRSRPVLSRNMRFFGLGWRTSTHARGRKPGMSRSTSSTCWPRCKDGGVEIC